MMMKNRKQMNRRGFLWGSGSAAGALALQSLATGIPAKILLDPLSASASDLRKGKILILSSSRHGDPINANVPGTYGFNDVYHSTDPAMAETALSLSGTQTTAAKPWADLSQGILDQTAFFHHATHSPVHGEMARVQRMMDETEKNDMLISLLARELAPVLGTVQSTPLSLGASGAELLSSAGRRLANVDPLSVRQALGGVAGPLNGKTITKLRDKHIDRVYGLYRERGTPDQINLLDAWARSRDEVRAISGALLDELETVQDNGQKAQATTAAVLAAMNIAPVITIHLDFGRDNHSDKDFAVETASHVSAMKVLKGLLKDLNKFKDDGDLKNDVLVGSLNVFGRTLKKKGTSGRDHNSGHHCMVLMGEGIKGGIVGGIQPQGNDYIAQSIDSVTGRGGDGDIPYSETLASAGKTLGYAMGISAERMNEVLPPGKIVKSVFDEPPA